MAREDLVRTHGPLIGFADPYCSRSATYYNSLPRQEGEARSHGCVEVYSACRTLRNTDATDHQIVILTP